MDSQETRQYEMLQRVRDFGNIHRQRFTEGGVAAKTFAGLAAVIDDLAATDIAKRSASAAARADRKAAARKALGDLLVQVSQTARVLQAAGHSMPPFDVPASRTDQAMLTAARQFARDAIPLEADFVAHGLQPKGIEEVASAFETAMRDRGMSRADHIEARTRIQQLFASASEHLRTLDVIIKNEMGRDKVIRTVWKRARRIDEARRPRGVANEKSPPAEAADVESLSPAAGE